MLGDAVNKWRTRKSYVTRKWRLIASQHGAGRAINIKNLCNASYQVKRARYHNC